MSFASSLDRVPEQTLTPAEKLREALALYDEGVALQRQNFRRRDPSLSELALDELLERWLLREQDV